jgi:enoyl-CoA hydratase
LRLPAATALELLLVGEPIDAERGRELGLVNSVVPEGGAREAATKLAHRIGANAPLAVQASKRLARVALTAGEDEAWMLNRELAASVTGSADAAEGARAASERRPAQWSGQ